MEPPLIFSVPFALTTYATMSRHENVIASSKEYISARTGAAWFYFHRVKRRWMEKKMRFIKKKSELGLQFAEERTAAPLSGS